MNYHKLLSKQILKYLPPELAGNSSIDKFLAVISESYLAFDKDKDLAERAFRITEEEYLEVNNQLKHEVGVRRQSVEKLKQAIGKITGVEKTNNTDDLLIIARYLNQQVSKRINAELVFNSLITNLPSAILLEDEFGQIVLTNQRFCEMFSLALPPEALQSTDSKKNLEEIRVLFKNPGKFLSRINDILKIKELVNGEIIELADGTILERDYIPIFLENKYKGNLWSYTDITDAKKAQEEYKRISLVASANQSGVLFTSFDGRITWANEGFYKMTGYSLKETIGKTPIELCRGPLTDKDSLDKVLNAFYNGNPFHIEIIYYRKDGSWFWGRSNTQPVKDSKGQVTQFFGIIDDVTEEKGTEDRFRMALEKIGDNVWEHNFESDETVFSDKESQLLGYSKTEFNNNIDLWWENIFPEDRPILEQNDYRYKTGQQSHHTLEYRMIHKSGEIKWVLDKGVVIEKTADDKPIRIIGTHTDITTIKKTEQALRENEKQFRSLAESIPGVLYKFEYGIDGIERFTYISPDPEKKIGITREQLENFYQTLHPADFEREKRISKNARENKMPYHFEGRFNVPKKSVIWLNISSSFSNISPEGRSVYTGIILDITKEKESEQAIHLREKKYRNIIANMNLGLLEVDNEEIVRFVNQSFCEMCGYKMEELIGKSASRLFVKDEDSEIMELRNQTRKKGLSDAYEILVKNKKGEPRWWLISGAPRYNDKGLLIGSIGIHLDITEQKKLENELVEAREQAESFARSKQVFLANMSHEIRTPMNAIIGMSNQLSKSALTKDQLFYLNIIHSAADNLLVIINDILDLSKLEAGKLNIEEIGFRPKALIEQSMQVMMQKAGEKGLALTNSYFDPSLSPVLMGDPYRLNQILLNLFSNGVKFTDKGVVDLTCRVSRDSPGEQLVEFIVMDTGIGMKEDFLKNLFQKFRQEDESVTRRFGGTGLGMSICKELIEFMGGTIRVESKKDIGTTIIFALPFKKGTIEQLPVKKSEYVNTGILCGKKILVTDDNEMNRLVATTILSNYGVLLSEAKNGIEALEKIKNETFDIILMDVQMPLMDGIETTKIIRQRVSKTLPVIALTALALKGDESKFRDAGMNDYLSKPFDENQLLQVISRCLGAEMSVLEKPKISVNPEMLYDLGKINEISKGSQSFVDKMVAMFIEQGPASVKEIRDSYDSKNFSRMGKVAHRFKTSVYNMGIESIKTEISEIELLAEQNKASEALENMISKTEKVIGAVVAKLKAR